MKRNFLLTLVSCILFSVILGIGLSAENLPSLFVILPQPQGIILLKGSGQDRTKIDRINYYDGQEFVTLRKFQNEKKYARFPQAYKNILREDIWNLGQNSAAKSIRKSQDQKQKSAVHFIDDEIDFAVKQYKLMRNLLGTKPGEFPKTTDKNGGLETCNSSWWTSGFFSGSLCLLYGETHDDSIRILSEGFMPELAKYQFILDNHDIGWIVNSSFGNWYRLTGNEQYGKVIVQTAKSLITRFNPTVGCIRTWDKSELRKGSDFLVNVDNMLNLELLMEAYKISNDSSFLKIAIQHADNTLKNQFRSDNSSFHVVDYNSSTGEVRSKKTGQGYSDNSSWARGQAWGLYGFTMIYRETGHPRYLKQAENIAEFIINHPRLPADKIPYWDFDSPDIPKTYKDASAGAIICSALIELSQYVKKTQSKRYISIAKQQLVSLSSPYYHAELGKNSCFILKHCVGNLPGDSEVDVPLIYADYYYLEALLRYKKLNLTIGK